ncbi:hypothetical protein BDA99DRAFT_563029 [Phascolomyces articulosus]|uniref:Uncharacterized protein n=1 Tax=Phascolomyces articulosus TaxID=60185 RepID=A0AAD5K3H0_9FUNG|nr:hypothetical protein BDA99DRAFT_563029 [Phascolomyces articulosus]
MDIILPHLNNYKNYNRLDEEQVLEIFKKSKISKQKVCEKGFKDAVRVAAGWSRCPLHSWAFNQALDNKFSILDTTWNADYWNQVHVMQAQNREQLNPTAPTSISITNPSDSKDSNETRQQSAQQIVEEEGQEKEGQEDFPSDITEDYHPTRTADYHFMIDEAESEKVGAEALDGDDDNNNELDHWIIGDINISKRLTDARLSCLRVQSKKCRISDCYAIHIMKKTQDISDESVICVHPTIGKISKKVTIPILSKAIQNNNTIDLVVANVLHQQSLEYTGNASQSPFEDTYVHRSIAALFKSVFQSDPLFSYDWANGALCAKRKMGSEAANAIQKPDFVAFVSSRKDLAVAEIKPPATTRQQTTATKSDLYHDIKSLSNLPMLIQDLLWLKNILKPTAVRVLQVESQKRTATPTATPNPFSPPKKYLDMDERTLLRSNKKQKKSSSD